MKYFNIKINYLSHVYTIIQMSGILSLILLNDYWLDDNFLDDFLDDNLSEIYD